MTAILPTTKSKAPEQEELTIPQHSILGANVPGFGDWQRAEAEAAQRKANVLVEIEERERVESRRHAEAMRMFADIKRSVLGGKPMKARRPSMPREELEAAILLALKTGEQSGSAVAESLQVDPNRVTGLLDELVKAKRVAHNGKEKKASRFSLPK